MVLHQFMMLKAKRKALAKSWSAIYEALSHNFKENRMPSVSRQRDYIRSRLTDYYPGEWKYDTKTGLWSQTLGDYGSIKRYSACVMPTRLMSYSRHLKKLDTQENIGMLCLWYNGDRTMLPSTLVTAPKLERCAEKLRPIGETFVDALKSIEDIRKNTGLIETTY